MVNTPALHTRMSRGAPSQAAANERTDAREARSSGRTSSAGRGSPAAAASAARAAMSLRPLSRDRQARTTEGRECRWGVGGHVRAGGQPRRPQAPPPVSPHRTARAAAGQGGRCLPANTTVDEEGGRWRGWAGLLGAPGGRRAPRRRWAPRRPHLVGPVTIAVMPRTSPQQESMSGTRRRCRRWRRGCGGVVGAAQAADGDAGRNAACLPPPPAPLRLEPGTGRPPLCLVGRRTPWGRPGKHSGTGPASESGRALSPLPSSFRPPTAHCRPAADPDPARRHMAA